MLRQSSDQAVLQGPAAQENGSAEEELWLLGQPPLKDYFHFVEDQGVSHQGLDGAAAARAARDEWQAANAYYQELERTEAGAANLAQRLELDASMAGLAAELRSHPRFRRSYDSLPTAIEMVALDHLMVFQHHVSRNFVDSLQGRIGRSPDPAALFGFCLPLGEREAPVEIRRVGSRRYAFRCQSTDFRYLESKLLRPEQLVGCEPAGPLAGVVALMVGFGPNFLSAIATGKRLLLNNGYHRACALRAAGLTHAPCIVQTAGSVDELELVAKTEITDDPQFYFESARPPLLKDFFNPRIRKLVPVRRRTRVIEVNFDIDDFMVDE